MNRDTTPGGYTPAEKDIRCGPVRDKDELIASLRKRIRHLILKSRISDPLLKPLESSFPVARMQEEEISTPLGSFLLLSLKLSESWPRTESVVDLYRSFCRENLEGIYGYEGHPYSFSPDDILYLDIETAGLSCCTVFLVGIMFLDQGDLVIKQYFARDYAEEGAMLYRLNQDLTAFKLLITFNGKSFDVPFLEARMAIEKIAFRAGMEHLDLLHHARRIWRGRTPNCRLTTLERLVCGRTRTGDIPGREIPDLYHRYVKTKKQSMLSPVFHHNRLDLLTMAELVMKIFDQRNHA